VLHIAEENAAENVLTCWRHMFKMEITSCPSCEKSWWTRGGVRQGTCELEKDLFQVAECDYEKVADNPEEALSPMASGKLPWMVGVKHRHIGFPTHSKHTAQPEAKRPQFMKLLMDGEHILIKMVQLAVLTS